MGWVIMPEGIKQTNQACEICDEPVTVGEPFYFRGKTGVVHAHCEWEEAEKRQKKEGEDEPGSAKVVQAGGI